jgi:signal transduction histidine kinase
VARERDELLQRTARLASLAEFASGIAHELNQPLAAIANYAGYLHATSDRELLDVAPPWLAWRALVIANPRWYPALTAVSRDRLLGWVERTLAAHHLDPRLVDEVAS